MKDTVREIFALRRNGYSGPFFQGLIVFTMGVWTLASDNAFDSSAKYDVMEEFASHTAWGFGLVLCSVLIIVGALSRKPREVVMGSTIIGAAWVIMFISFYSSAPESPINAIALVMIFRCMSLYKEFWTQFDHVTGKPHRFDERGNPQ